MPETPKSPIKLRRLCALFLCVLMLSLTGTVSRAQAAAPFDQQTLDELLAPIALYPDALLTQVLIASTYPLEVVQAARFVDRNRDMAPDALGAAADTQQWDPSVTALVRFPSVLAMMDEKLDWTQKLGDAFLAQQAGVMDTVQSLRERAYAAGNLTSNPQQDVVVQDRVIVIQPAQPQIVYVPFFNPAFVYGNWWWATPPRWVWVPPPRYRPPGWGPGWGPGIGWGRPIGAPPWIWHGRAPNWHDRNIVVNNNTIIVNNRGPRVWTPDPGPRRGISNPGARNNMPPTMTRPGNPAAAPGRAPESRPAPTRPGVSNTVPEVGMPPAPGHAGPPRSHAPQPRPAPGSNTPQSGPRAPAGGVAPSPSAQPTQPNGSAAPTAPPAARAAPPAARPAPQPADRATTAGAPRSAPPERSGADRDTGGRPGTSVPARATP